jgi:hypothetical protein
MAKQVRLTLAKAIAKANLKRAEAGEKAITMNSLAVQAGVSATTITRLARPDWGIRRQHLRCLWIWRGGL